MGSRIAQHVAVRGAALVSPKARAFVHVRDEPRTLHRGVGAQPSEVVEHRWGRLTAAGEIDVGTGAAKPGQDLVDLALHGQERLPGVGAQVHVEAADPRNELRLEGPAALDGPDGRLGRELALGVAARVLGKPRLERVDDARGIGDGAPAGRDVARAGIAEEALDLDGEPALAGLLPDHGIAGLGADGEVRPHAVLQHKILAADAEALVGAPAIVAVHALRRALVDAPETSARTRSPVSGTPAFRTASAAMRRTRRPSDS